MSETTHKNKLIAKNTLYLYIRLIVSLCISLYTSRAFLDALGVDDFGIYNVVGGFVSMLSLFTTTITSAAQRFITYELGTGDFEKLKKTFSTFLSILLFLCVVIIIIGELFGLFFLDNYLVIPEERMHAAHVVFQCSLIAFIIDIISVPYVACVTAHEHMSFFALVSIGQSVLKLVIVFLLYILTFDRLETYAILLVVVGLLVRVIYTFYCRRHFEEVNGKLSIDRNILKEIFSYSVWVSIGASSAIFKEQGVNVLINMFFGVAMNAARGISIQALGVLNQFANGISQAITPQITKSYANGELQRSIKLTFLLTKAQGIMLLMIALPLLIETEYVLDLWLKDVPDYAVIFTRWAIILCIARTLENTHSPIFLATGKVKKLQIIGGGVMLLNLPISYIALKAGYMPESTMIIGVIIELLVMAIAYVYLKKVIDFPVGKYYKSVVIPLLIVAFLSAIIPLYISRNLLNYGLSRLVVVTISSVIVTILLSYTISLSKNERKMVNEFVINKCKFLKK